MRDLERFRPRDALLPLCGLVLVAALVLGGGTRDGFLSDAVLQLLAVPLLLVALWRIAETPPHSPARRALAACCILAAVPLLQVVPLPPSIWTRLPGREAEIETFRLLGGELPWMPISVSAQATWLSALSLTVPISVFLATLLLGFSERRLLSLLVLGVGLASVFLGLSQVAQGPASPLRFFDFSNPTEAVGFFANRNHFAALLYSLTLLAAAWAANAGLASERPCRRYDAGTLVPLIAAFTVLVALVGAQAMARSRAGLGLTIIALAGAFALAFADRRGADGSTPARVLFGAVGLAAMFATQFALYRIMERLTSDPLQNARIPFARTTIEAAGDFMPFGSGMGTFVPVYALYERPHDALAETYANRAHNDVLEIWLEAGVIGLALMGAFAVWFALRCLALWRRAPYGEHEIDRALARAATFVVGLLIAHSFVDYPLRTGAMMAVFAFCCALLIAPAPSRGDVKEPARAQVPEPAAVAMAPAHLVGTGLPEATAAQRLRARWGEHIEWPEEWRRPAAGRRPDES